MNNSPRVTIITPAYNREDLIEKTITSILDQKYPNLEYIVIDDGSSDNTYNVAKKYIKKLTIIKQKNKGETYTVNKGLTLSTGDIIAVINSDDPLLPNSIRIMADFFTSHPKVIAAYPDWIMINKNGEEIEKVTPIEFSYETMLKQHYCIPGPGTFFRREAVKLTGGRSRKFKYIADFAFWLKLGLYGDIAHIPKKLATFRVHSGAQGIYSHGSEMAQEHISLVDWIFNDKDFPLHMSRFKNQAYSSAYFHGARETTSNNQKLVFYLNSFFLNPLSFFTKIRYEIVKLKHKLISKNKI